MSFEQFIDIIIKSFNDTFNGLINIINPLFENNFIKLIIFIILLHFVIENLGEIISLIKNIFSMKKESSKNKVKSNTDIE